MYPEGVPRRYGSSSDSKYVRMFLQVLWRICTNSAYESCVSFYLAKPVEAFPMRKRDISRVVKVVIVKEVEVLGE